MAPGSRIGLSPQRLAAVSGWGGALACLGCIQFLVTRGCGYELAPPLLYAAHFGLQVYLPGVLALAWLTRGPISLTSSLALGVPTGYAIELGAFLLLAAVGLKSVAPFVPVVWLGWLAVTLKRRGALPVRGRVSWRHAGLALALSVLFLVTVLAAVAHMFAESPLVNGLPQRPIFHDWIYLISRAAAIRAHWPLEDPSLAGFPLQYHYFLLVHVASAAQATGLEIGQILLRLVPVPLGAVLVAQVFALGRIVSRRAWGGVMAAGLMLLAGEMGFEAQLNESVFLGRFVRWLFVSPTHYFGMIYFGALLLVLIRWMELPRITAREVLSLFALGAVATGAKGTVLPVLLPALALWAAWTWGRTRRFPLRLVIAGAGLFAAFALVYETTMARWGTAAAALVPYDVFGVSGWWRQALPEWTARFAAWLPPGLAAAAAALFCASVVLAGTFGVRLLAFGACWWRGPKMRRPAVELLTVTALCSVLMGAMMRLDGDGELYLFLLVRVPASVLAAAVIMQALAAWRSRRAGGVDVNRPRSGWRAVGIGALAAVLVVTLALQVRSTALGLRQGLAEWRNPVLRLEPSGEMRLLHDAMLWLRHNAEPDAIVMANAFTELNRNKDRWGALDAALVGVHFYYSALAERRLLLEGPNYLLDPKRVIQRMEVLASVFYRQQAPSLSMFDGAPGYILLDRGVGDGANVALPESARVFSNARIDLFRVPRAIDTAGMRASLSSSL